MAPSFYFFAELWESLQVELRGKYSAERVLQLTTYTKDTSWVRVIVILIVTPLPCLLVTVLVDILPLAEPSEGIQASTMYFARTYYTYIVATFLVIEQFRVSIKVLPYPFWKRICTSLLVSALTTGLLYGLIMIVGFPLPFSMVIITTPWAMLFAISMAFEWARKIQTTPGAVKMLLNAIKLAVCEILLLFIYPPYFYIFTTLSNKAQMAFALLLPAIKIVLRNLFSRTILHLTDELPEVVIFNCDVFSALFVSYCMQNSPSLWTTLEIMAVDIIMMAMSLRDAEATKEKLKSLEQRIEQENYWNNSNDAIKVHGLTTLKRASMILQRKENPNVRLSSHLELKHEARKVDTTPPGQTVVLPKRSIISIVDSAKSFGCKIAVDQNILTMGSVYPAITAAGNGAQSLPVTIQYTHMVRQLLYMTEFLLLLNYVEVIIPLVFSVYLYAMYHLPNREYYSELRGMNEDELIRTLNNVLFYCSLQLLSLFLLFFALQKKLGLSPIHHLAFVLDKQCLGLQAKLVMWVYYNAQASLQHAGYDYTFQFSWLQPQSGSKPGD